MNRICSNKRISEAQVRYRSHIESDPCAAGTVEARGMQYNLLRTIIDTPDLLTCGPVVFESMKMFHGGTCWVAELEAVVDEPQNDSP